PEGCLLAAALPVAGFAVAHRVPAGLVLPVIIAAAQSDMLLGPDDLGTQLKPAGCETGGNDLSAKRAVPNIGDVPGEERIRFAPVGAIVVEHPALRQLAGAMVPLRSPGGVVADAIRWIGHHQVRP